MATELSDPISAPEPRQWWRLGLVALALVVAMIVVLHRAAPRLLSFGSGGAGAGGLATRAFWDAELPASVSPGELQITFDMTFEEEPPCRAALLAAMPSFVDRMPPQTGPPIVGSVKVRVSPIRRERSGFRPFHAEERWEVDIAYEFEGTCDGHPLRCRSTDEVNAHLESSGLVAIDAFERELSEWLGSMIADAIGLEIQRGRSYVW